jgi:hypothetical protein
MFIVHATFTAIQAQPTHLLDPSNTFIYLLPLSHNSITQTSHPEIPETIINKPTAKAKPKHETRLGRNRETD